jgi:hypothetical protein
MANATIGALRVDLGLNSAQFTAGLKKAESGIGNFAKRAGVGLALVAAAAASATVALGFAVKKSIDHADALSKSAQKAGVSVEALSRLAYAAQFSDVSLEGLTGGLQKLSKAMADSLISPTATSALAFKDLGISVTDASGNLRDSGDVLAQIADKFANLKDGSKKTSLAMQIFGKSGAELIPLLNGGAASLKQFADESDRTGNTLSTKTAKAAEEFNDNLTKLGASVQGLVNTILPAILPLLDSITKALSDTDPQTLAVAAGLTAVAAAAATAAPAVVTLTGAMKLLYAQLALIAALPGGVLALAGGIFLGSTTGAGTGEDALVKSLGLTKIPAPKNTSGSPDDRNTPIAGFAPTTFDFGSLFGGQSKSGGGGGASSNAITAGLDVIGKSLDDVTQKATAFADTAASAFSDFADAVLSGTDPLKAMADELGNIGKMLLDAGIQSLFRNIFTSAPGTSFLSGIPGFAAGTMSAPAGLAWVGENGPELMNFRGGESVMPAAQSAAMGGPNISISISGSKNDAAAIARQVSKTLPDAIAAYNRNPLRRS